MHNTFIVNNLEIVELTRFKLLGITKSGNALTKDIKTNGTVLIKKKDYNILLLGALLEGAIVNFKDITMFKTLQF